LPLLITDPFFLLLIPPQQHLILVGVIWVLPKFTGKFCGTNAPYFRSFGGLCGKGHHEAIGVGLNVIFGDALLRYNYPNGTGAVESADKLKCLGSGAESIACQRRLVIASL